MMVLNIERTLHDVIPIFGFVDLVFITYLFYTKKIKNKKKPLREA